MSAPQEMIRDARKQLRKASGLRLTDEEQNEDVRKSAVKKLRVFVLSRLGVVVPDALCGKVAWTDSGAALIMNAEGRALHMRKAEKKGSYQLFFIESDGEREIAQIDGEDPHFASRILAAIGDWVPSQS